MEASARRHQQRKASQALATVLRHLRKSGLRRRTKVAKHKHRCVPLQARSMARPRCDREQGWPPPLRSWTDPHRAQGVSLDASDPSLHSELILQSYLSGRVQQVPVAFKAMCPHIADGTAACSVDGYPANQPCLHRVPCCKAVVRYLGRAWCAGCQALPHQPGRGRLYCAHRDGAWSVLLHLSGQQHGMVVKPKPLSVETPNVSTDSTQSAHRPCTPSASMETTRSRAPTCAVTRLRPA